MQAGDDRSGPAVDGAGQAAAFEPALGMERDPGAAWVLSIAGLDRRLEGAKLFGIHKAGSQSSLRRRMLPSKDRKSKRLRPQSLMRISFAGFCLKIKKLKITRHTRHH